MDTFPKSLLQLGAALLHSAAIPVCFLASAMLYEPRALTALMHAGESYAAIADIPHFNMVICASIMLVVMVLSRIPILWVMRKHIPMSLWRYTFWCIGEILVCCAFCALFLSLMDHDSLGGYFAYFGRCISAIGSVLILPYLIITQFYLIISKQENAPLDEGARLKFYDMRHQLKFITEASSVQYIESNENYIIIHYLENGVEKRYQLRNSMKNIEPLCERAGFARTHRCFIVNPRHVKMIRKEPGGVNVADLGLSQGEGIPISKKYYDSIAAML